MYRRLLLTLMIAIVTISCSKKVIPLEGYKALLNKKFAERIEDIDLQRTTDLKMNSPRDSELKLEDSVFKYDETLLSNYEVFKFKALPSKKYRIIIYSYCDCLGFKKYLFDPEIKVINQSGEPVNIKLESRYFNPKSSPLAYDKSWVTEQQLEGDYYVILYANTSKLQQAIYSSVVTAYTGMLAPVFAIPVPVNIKSTLVGNFRIQIQDK